MAYFTICPTCNENNSGAALTCVKCETSLVGVPRQQTPQTPAESAAQQRSILQHQVNLVERKVKAENIFKGSASNFYWIAGLSLINSISRLSGGNFTFSIGLGATQVIDAFGYLLARDLGGGAASFVQTVAFLLDIFLAGIFVFFGFFANRQKGWAFMIGMILYALDGLIFLIVPDWLSIGFHIFILFGLYTGYRSMGMYQEVKQQISA